MLIYQQNLNLARKKLSIFCFQAAAHKANTDPLAAHDHQSHKPLTPPGTGPSLLALLENRERALYEAIWDLLPPTLLRVTSPNLALAPHAGEAMDTDVRVWVATAAQEERIVFFY